MRNPVLLSAIGLLIAGISRAQNPERIDLGQFKTCTRCVLPQMVEARLRIPSAAGDNDQESWATFDAARQEFLVVVPPARVHVFAANGTLVRSFGRRGDGPGEFRMIREIAPAGDRLIVMDVGQKRWTVTDRSGKTLRSAPLESGRDFALAGGDTLVVAAMGMAPATVGYPLHLASLSTGEEFRHFGSQTGEFNAAVLWSDRVLMGASQSPGRSWIAKPGRLHFEEWTCDNRLTRVIDGTPDWFPPVVAIQPFGQKPLTRMREFAFDDEGRLWVASWVAAADWQEGVKSAKRLADGETLINTAEYFATRVDVFDLRTRAYLGGARWESDKVRLIRKGPAVHVQLVEFDESANATLTLYRLDLRPR